MKDVCIVCGERLSNNKCACGFDTTKNYDGHRTLGKISGRIVSVYKVRKDHDDKVKKAYADANKKVEKVRADIITSIRQEDITLNGGDVIYELAEKYYKGIGTYIDYSMAYKLALAAAEKKNVKALEMLGDIYFYGKGVSIDTESARQWYDKAAKAGSDRARKILNTSYKVTNQQPAKTTPNTTTVVSKPSPATATTTVPKVAQNTFEQDNDFKQGKRFYYGEGTSPNLKSAFEFFTKSADKGNAEAMFFLGNMYAYGSGVNKDANAAKEWYIKSAKLGCDRAAKILQSSYNMTVSQINASVSAAPEKDEDFIKGKKYYYGEGVSPNLKVAFDCFSKCANKGNAEAMYFLGNMYHYGSGVAKDEVKSKEMLKASASKGNEKAISMLKKLDEESSDKFAGLAQSIKNSPKLNIPDDVKDMNKARNYFYGIGSSPQPKTAFPIFAKCAENGNAEAMYFLGFMYHSGSGVTRDETAAKNWFIKSAKLGNERSKKSLEKIYGMKI